MARADLRKAEDGPRWAELGRVVRKTMELARLNLQQFAAAVGKDERQVARWMTGEERPQCDLIYAVPALRQPFILALAEDCGLADIETTITLRRVG